MRRSRRNRRKDRGSALLVSLMVIVGLSLLGLGFVAISETESAIAKNEQNALQTQAVAEAGAKLVVEWFQDPDWAATNAAAPTNTTPAIGSGIIPAANAIKRMRTTTDYSGIYKADTSKKLFDKPYRPDPVNRFFGDEDHADITINRATNPGIIDNFNDVLLASNGNQASGDDKIAGEVTEIKIYAPPIVGGDNINGFWSGGTRYGVATIKVTAKQFVSPPARGAAEPTSGAIASHSVRLVVGELPLPIPAGPIQGNANVSFGGNFRVHWGMETSRGDLTPSLNLSSLPWANAYERPHFEHGYEPGKTVSSLTILSPGSGYTTPPTISFTCNAPCTGSGAAATATINGGQVTAITVTNRGTGYMGQEPPQVVFSAPPSGGAMPNAYVNIGAEAWPVSPGSVSDGFDFFHEMLAKDFQDPFYGCRAFQDNLMNGTDAPNVLPQLYPYTYTSDEQSNSGPSYAFQWQDSNIYPNKKKVVFPTILYDYWKKIAQAGRGYKGIYYFKYAGGASGGGGNFTRFGVGTPQSMPFWVNTVGGAKLGPGVYFFDTKNGSNPQLPGADRTQLTDNEFWKSSDFGSPSMLMSGFVYTNSAQFGTQGMGNSGTQIQANFPGEPFRDAGYPRWNTIKNDWDKSCGESSAGANDGQICRWSIGDGVFGCQDLKGPQDPTPGAPAGVTVMHTDSKCRIVVMKAPTWNSYDPALTPHTSPYTMPACGSGCSNNETWVVKTWKSPAQATADYGQPCQIPPDTFDGSIDGTNNGYCSEPHEPYLNLIFPDQAADNNGAPYKVVVGWEPPNNITTRSKLIDNAGNPVPCGSGPPYDTTKCITNAYDVDGGVVPLTVILDGILYVEGTWNSAGNAWFYGSILVQDPIQLGTGTADVWFDEKLLKGTWAPPGMPRVVVFSEQTDEQTQ